MFQRFRFSSGVHLRFEFHCLPKVAYIADATTTEAKHHLPTALGALLSRAGEDVVLASMTPQSWQV